MDYFTTSLLPSGNRLVTEDFCPGLMLSLNANSNDGDGDSDDGGMIIPRLLQEVDIQNTADALLLGNSSDRSDVRWIVGTPSSTSSSNQERHFWMVLDNGDQYRLSSNNDNDNEIERNNDIDNVLSWSTTDSADRPLVIARTPGPNNQTQTELAFLPLEQPSMASPLSSAVPTPNGGFLLVERTTTNTYQLTQLARNLTDVTHASLRSSLVVDPLPDAALSYSSQHQLWAVYTSATSRYNHAVLGDPLEAHALTVLHWNADTELVEFHSQSTLEDEPESDTVFEGLGVLWADVNGDGRDEVVTTISNRDVGARLRVYIVTDSDEPQLSLLAQAPAIGLGGRWLHQLAVGGLGPQGETELVEIRTPHIGGIVRYYRWDGSNELQLVASTSRYTSHDIRSRNLDKAVAGDFNGDGIPELVVQNQAKTMLVGLQRTTTNNDGVETVWSIPLSTPVASNLAVSCSNDPGDEENGGILEIMFATENQNLVKLQFAPTTVNADVSDEMISRSGASTSGGVHAYHTSGRLTAMGAYGNLERLVFAFLFVGMYTVIVRRASSAF